MREKGRGDGGGGGGGSGDAEKQSAGEVVIAQLLGEICWAVRIVGESVQADATTTVLERREKKGKRADKQRDEV